jgi:hypothetical protein
MLPLLLSLALAADSITAFGQRWQVPVAGEWSFANGELRMLVARPQEANPRYPVQYAVLEGPDLDSFTLECEVRRDSGSLILVYNWQGPAHFNYVHLSVDSPEKVAVHNGIFHVYGSDRSRISKAAGPGSLPTRDWIPVRLDYDAPSGKMVARVGGQELPSLTGVDLSLTRGKVGLGSFFETAQFRNFRLTRR